MNTQHESVPKLNKQRRRILRAVLLSLLLPGLGHVYCGRIAKGLAFMALNLSPAVITWLGSAVIAVEEEYYSLWVIIIGVSISAWLIIWLTSMSGAYRVAKKSYPDYIRKDFNNIYLYIFLFLIINHVNSSVINNIRQNFLTIYKIPAGGSFPTALPGDMLLGNILVYEKAGPRRGDVVVFQTPGSKKILFGKRVVAIEGDTIEIKNNQLFVNDEKLGRELVTESVEIPIDRPEDDTEYSGDVFYEFNAGQKYKIVLQAEPEIKNYLLLNFKKTTVPEYHCFVMGDNRNTSIDSRHFGPIPLSSIKSKLEYIILPDDYDWSRYKKLDQD